MPALAEYVHAFYEATIVSGGLVQPETLAGELAELDDDVRDRLEALGLGTLATLDGTAGTYSPELTHVTNIAASTSFTAQYLRVGNTVHVAGKLQVDPTAAAASELGISLPIAVDFSADHQCSGVAFSAAVAGQGAAILADIADDRASMQWIATNMANQVMTYNFMYRLG